MHSRFSDGGDSPEEVIEEALRCGFDYLGFAEHFSPTQSLWLYPGCYLMTRDIARYVEYLHTLKIRYQDKIRVLTGLETYTIGSRVLDLPFDEFTGIDFLLFEDMHDDPNPVETLRLLRLKLPHKPIGLAHFDFSCVDAQSLLSALVDLNVFLELNTSYAQLYRQHELVFRKLAHTKLLISICSDAHNLQDISKTTDAEDFVLQLKLENGLLQLLRLLSVQT